MMTEPSDPAAKAEAIVTATWRVRSWMRPMTYHFRLLAVVMEEAAQGIRDVPDDDGD